MPVCTTTPKQLPQLNKAAHIYILSKPRFISEQNKLKATRFSGSIQLLSTEIIDNYSSNTLTIFNHGTGGSSMKSASSRELINLIGNQFLGPKEITEGVDSIGDPDRVHYYIDDKNRLQKVRLGKNTQGQRLWNSLKGIGMQNNVDNLLVKLRWLKSNNRLPQVINMTGWSRGGATSIRQANAIAREFPSVKINIFAIDPVGGFLKNFSYDNHHLPPAVKSFTATLAENEKRLAFAPVDKSFLTHTNETNVKFLTFPGIHRDLAKFDNDSGIVNADLMLRFLQQHGSIDKNSELFKAYTMAEHEKIDRYRSLQSARNTPEEYALNKKDKIQLSNPLKKQLQSGSNFNFRITTKKYTDYPELFVNSDHEFLFKSRYPNVYAAYFEGRTFTDKMELENEYREIPIKQKIILDKILDANNVASADQGSLFDDETNSLHSTFKKIINTNKFIRNIQDTNTFDENTSLDKFIKTEKKSPASQQSTIRRKVSSLKNDFRLLIQFSSKLKNDTSVGFIENENNTVRQKYNLSSVNIYQQVIL